MDTICTCTKKLKINQNRNNSFWLEIFSDNLGFLIEINYTTEKK